MPAQSFHRIKLAFLLAFSCLMLSNAPTSATPPEEKRPRLAVLLVFDQMRGDYPKRWQNHFDKDGLGKLLRDGAWYQNCHYPYANTMTAAGHASMSTGCIPAKHGVVANSWFDRTQGDEINAVRTPRFRYVPANGKGGAGPVNLKRPTIGDALMEQTKGKAKVVSISIKDRAAILLAALRACLCFWLNPSNGSFVTSTHYQAELPNWVEEFNKERVVDRWFNKGWTRLRPDLNYEKLSGKDRFLFEGVGYSQKRTFPHPTNGGLKKPGRSYYSALSNSPFGNELVLEMGKRAIEAEKLGQDDDPDLLCLGFSSNDYVGHCWGPDSQEVLDMTLRSDLLIKDLLNYLDLKVGKDNYMVVVCADHGVCPLPEVTRLVRKQKAGRISPQILTSKASTYLSQSFADGKKLPWIESTSSGMVYFNKGTLQELKLDQAKVERALADWLTKQPGIKAAYTRSELSKGPIKNDPLAEQVRLSFHPDASGDVMPVIEPYYLLSPPLLSKKTGPYTTTHGSPHPYDTHVPLIVFGANVKAGIRKERVTPQTVASIIAEGLGVQLLGKADYDVPKGLWK